jgi:Type I restriction modification DNA specificity domain
MKQLPVGWALVSLGDLTQPKRKRVKPSSLPNHPYVGMEHVEAHSMRLLGTVPASTMKSTAVHFKKGDVLYGRLRPYLNKVLLAEFEGLASPEFIAMPPAEEVRGRYLQYFLNHSEFVRFAVGLNTGDRPRVDFDQLKVFPVPLPPLPVQDAIIDEIEKHASRIETAQNAVLSALPKLTVLRSAILDSLTEGEWPRRAWRELGASQNGRAFPSRDYSDEGIKLLRPGNLHPSGRIAWTESNTRRLPFRYEVDFPKYVVGPGELVMNLTAQSLKDDFLGRVCITDANEHCLLNQRLARLIPSEHLSPTFLLYVLKARRFRMFVQSLNKGSLIQHMFTSQLDTFEVPIPPIREQHRIVSEIEAQLSKVDALATSMGSALDRAVGLRRSIVHQAFSGELLETLTP